MPEPTPIVIPHSGVVETVFIVEWLRAAGARVEAGEEVVVVESEKAETAIEAPAGGNAQDPHRRRPRGRHRGRRRHDHRSRGGVTALSRFSLDGRVALVTGAASGLGRAIAVGFAEAGARVRCVDRDTEGIEEVARSIGEAADAVTADVIDAEAITAAVDGPGRRHQSDRRAR